MIEEIVEGISNQLLSMKSVDFSNIVGMNIHMERLIPLLSMESENKVRMIGIWGMGGIGKTTIAKCLFDRFSRGFPARCFLENVSKIYRTHGVSYLTRFLSTTLGLSEKKMKFPGAELGPHELKSRLENRKVFVVLDNVDDMKQMHALAQEFSWFGPGSRIIITTRDKGLLNSYSVRTVYEVKCLDTDDSLQIFNQIAFEGGLPPSDCYNHLSFRASMLARGLPSAIEAYGLFFRRLISLDEWEDALCRFERTPHANVVEVLKISYDGLEEADKRVFLHVACLFSGETLRRAVTLLNDDELQGSLGVRMLAEKSLIEITDDGYIKMHFLVEQTAREIERQESSVQRPMGGRRVVWDPNEVYEVLRRNRESESVACMALHMCEMPDELYLYGYVKNDHNNLKFLKVHRHSDHVEPMLHFMSDDTYLLSLRLRLLHWDAFPLTDFPLRFRPLGLVEVSLRYSNLASLLKGTKWLLHLRRLDLTGCKNLELLPDLSQAMKLEEVITKGCKRLKRIPESISNLTSLTTLDVSDCDELTSNYHITVKEFTGRCWQTVVYFSSNEVEMKSVTYLSIGGNIQIQMVGLAGNLDHLCFSTEKQEPHVLTSMYQKPPPLFCGHERTKKVEQKKKYRPNKSEFHGLNAIEMIRFNYKSDGESFLCHSLYMFPCLKELNLINLNIQVIPDDVSALQLLEKLDWTGNDFESLPETMNQLPRLKHVSLCNCTRLKALPELVELESIKLSGCVSLQSLLETSLVEPGLCRYQWIELWVDGCKNIQSISDQLRHLTKLSNLDLSSHEFETLPSSIIELSSLGTLSINKCKKLKSVEGVPLSVKYLYAHGCESLETVSLPLEHSIKHLDLSHCFCLTQNKHLITQFLNEAQNVEESLRFACLPATEVPSYFGDPKTRTSITLEIPQVLASPTVMAFDACVLLACLRPFGLQFSPFSYNWSWEVDRIFRLELKPAFFRSHDESSFHTFQEEEAVESDHLVIFRASKTLGEEIHSFRFKSDLLFSEEFKCHPAEIKSCGARLILEDEQADLEKKTSRIPLIVE
ncbi:ADP-ribosyl cyclase/cyclic ADP-ribose hydrolase [Hirschfeldia incana]|nr:ADP-ribosyl cyclase/cyclic ADP-ribose hydrolase [Hirschfeldia incana]